MKFTEINLIEPIQKALVQNGYEVATPIQAGSIPPILDQKDLVGIAQTGTGKTAAFTLPTLQLMYLKPSKSNKIRTLVLAPTRELAAQIEESFSSYGSFTGFKQAVIFGGVNQKPQEKAMKSGVDILIATPGRLLDLVDQGIVDLGSIEIFILDEADRMLDMGFINDVKRIVTKLPKKRQSLFFSATMSPNVSELANQLLQNPVRVEITPQATTVEKIKQGIYFVDRENKDKLLLDIIDHSDLTSVLVFTKTKHKANRIVTFLEKNGVEASAIHGNKSQLQRVKALNSFKSGKINVLVATDIAARGIDIEDISHVLNYDLPNEPENYVHRIGRTARAGASGTAYSLCTAEDREYLRDIEKVTRQTIPVIEHEYHSDRAQNAKGSEARPAPKTLNKPNHKAEAKERYQKLGQSKPTHNSTFRPRKDPESRNERTYEPRSNETRSNENRSTRFDRSAPRPRPFGNRSNQGNSENDSQRDDFKSRSFNRGPRPARSGFSRLGSSSSGTSGRFSSPRTSSQNFRSTNSRFKSDEDFDQNRESNRRSSGSSNFRSGSGSGSSSRGGNFRSSGSGQGFGRSRSGGSSFGSGSGGRGSGNRGFGSSGGGQNRGGNRRGGNGGWKR